MKKCVFPGSFDPITTGHVDIVKRALEVFDEVIIAVGVNVGKKSLLSDKEKTALIADTFKDEKRVKVMLFSGLLTEFCDKIQVYTVVRGLRDAKDFEYELVLDTVNKKLSAKFDTIYFATRQEYLHISSSFVREILAFNGDISKFVPENVVEFFNKRSK